MSVPPSLGALSLLALAAALVSTGCGTTYLITTGQLVRTDLKSAVKLSAAHDLRCEPEEIKDVSEGPTLMVEGCGFRASYEIRGYGDSDIVVMTSRVKTGS